jgi:hypothetical protein
MSIELELISGVIDLVPGETSDRDIVLRAVRLVAKRTAGLGVSMARLIREWVMDVET